MHNNSKAENKLAGFAHFAQNRHPFNLYVGRNTNRDRRLHRPQTLKSIRSNDDVKACATVLTDVVVSMDRSWRCAAKLQDHNIYLFFSDVHHGSPWLLSVIMQFVVEKQTVPRYEPCFE